MEIPKELIERIADGSATVFIGAGLSQGAGLPGWPKLLEQMMAWGKENNVVFSEADEKELKTAIQEGELLWVAEELRERLGKPAFHQFMREIFQQSKPLPTDAHRLLPAIPFSSVLTTNYDRLLEKVYEDSYKDASFHSFTHRDYPELAMAIRSGEFYLLKLHGTIDRIETIVLGSSDYREVMYKTPAYRQFLKTLFSSKTILFLGFGLTDPDFNFLLDELKTTFNDYTVTHYALMNSNEATPLKRKRFEKDYNIKILPYTPSEPHHPEVIEFLKKLSEKVKKIKKKAAPGESIQVSVPEKLVEEVKAWLQALGYEISMPERLDDRIMQMTALLDKGTVTQRVLIRCIGDEIKLSDVEALDEVLTRKVPQGWLITDTRISKPAKQRAAADDEAYRLFTLSQFLEHFDNDQIRQVIINCLGKKKGKSAADRILNNKNLAEMARKPVLIELLLAAMEEVDPGILENQSQVYLYATNKLLLRNIDTKRTFSTTVDKLYFLCELAWEMIASQDMQIHYKEIPERITGYFGDKIKDEHELDHWDFDLRSQTLLHRNAAGYYEFAHKSLAEYFVAFKFAAELGCLASEFKNTYKEEDGQTCDVPYGELGVEALAKTFGAIPMDDERLKAVNQIFIGMLAKDSQDRLWQLLRETKGKSLDQVQYVGGNLVYILQGKFYESFKGAELSRVVLFGSAFQVGADLTGTNMKGAILHGVNFRASAFANTDLRDADLKDIHLSPPEISSLLYSVHRDILIAGLSDGSVRGWNTKTWEETLLFTGLSWEICSIIATPDRRRIIFGDRKNTAVLWDLDSGKELQRFENKHGQRHQMAISPDGNILACVDNSNAIILFDIPSGNPLKTFHGTDLFFCAAFNEDGSKLIGGDKKGNITIWGAADGGELKKWNSKLKTIYNICHSKNRPRFFACGYPFDNNEIFHCWDSETGEALFPVNSDFVSAVAFDNKETRFAMGKLLGEIIIIDSESGTPIQTLKLGEDTNAIAFSPDDQFLASGDDNGTIRIWDVNESGHGFGKCVKIIDVKSNCNGMKISGARGLEQKMEWPVQGKDYEGTLLEYFIECGAIPDEKQKKQLAELKKKKKRTRKKKPGA